MMRSALFRPALSVPLVLLLAASISSFGDPPDIVWIKSGHAGGASSVAVSSDGQMMASGGSDQTIKLWRLSDGMALRTLAGHGGLVKSVALSPDGLVLASGSADKTIKLWRVADGMELRTIPAHKAMVESVAFSQDGQMLASAGSLYTDDSLKLWRVADGELERTFKVTGIFWSAVAFSANGQYLASGGAIIQYPYDSETGLWLISSGALLWSRARGGQNELVTSVSLSPDTQYLTSTVTYGQLTIRRAADGALIKQVEDAQAAALAYTSDGREVAAGGRNPFIKRWQVPEGTLIKSYDMPAPVTAVQYTPHSKYIAFGCGNGAVGLLRRVPLKKGDANCDALVDFGDINPFVLALSDPQEYERQYPACDIANADIDGNGQVDFGDINPFVELLSR